MDDNEETPKGLRDMLEAVFGEGYEFSEFKPFFEHNPVLNTLTFYACEPARYYEHAVAGTNLIVLRRMGTDEIIGFTVCQYSQMGHESFSGAPN